MEGGLIDGAYKGVGNLNKCVKTDCDLRGFDN